MTDTGPLFVSSGDLIADRRYKWALDQAARGDFVAAADILAQTVALAPSFATAWFALGAIRDRLDDRAGAIAAFENARDADPEDYHGARLQLARLGSGDAAPAMSETYVRRLFDQYAARYDMSLTERLAYRGPALLREAVEKAMRAAGRVLRFRSMLDLGCGTGLGGAAFRPVADRLVGVDLSPAMTAQAETKSLYDRLVTADLTDFLVAEAGNAAKHDLVLAADVFVYVNDLGADRGGGRARAGARRPFRLYRRDPFRRRREAFADAALRARRAVHTPRASRCWLGARVCFRRCRPQRKRCAGR